MLEVQSVTYKIGDADILNTVTLSLNTGHHLLIHGASGCGKSTLMHIMAGLLKPTSGTVRFNDKDYNTLPDTDLDKLRGKNFGFVFQKMNLIGHLTAQQNIELASPKIIDDTIINDLGLKHLMTHKASTLSVGEAQRVALARALASHPFIIFADEPTSALDQANADKVMEMLFTQAQKHGASLVVTSHDDRIQSRFENKLDLSHD